VVIVDRRVETALTHQYLAVVDYRVLGPVEVVIDGESRPIGGAKQRTVLAMLVAAAGRPVGVDQLLQAVYGEDAASTYRATLHTYISNLRRIAGDVIVRRGDSYVLEMAGAAVDAVAFEDAYRAAVGAGSADLVATQLRAALAMWRGHPYVDVEAHGLLDAEMNRLVELRLAALEARIDADLRAGRHREVVAELDALTVEHPFREELRAMHMLALYRSGRQGDALRAYGRTRDVLVEGLGIDPSPALQELERRILAQDRSLSITVAPQVLRRAVLVADLDDVGWSDPQAREAALARRDSALSAAAERDGGVQLAPRGSAAYVVFDEPIEAVRAARAVIGDAVRVAIDVGDLEMLPEEPAGPPLARVARLVAVAHPGQALLSASAHDILTAAAEAGWAAESLGRFDIIGLDPAARIYQLVGRGFGSDFSPLRVDRLPPPIPGGLEGSVPGYELRDVIGAGELGVVRRAYQASVGREVAVRIFGPELVAHPRFVRRFEVALQRVGRVEHPHLVPVLDYWREPQRALVVSRLMAGGDLSRRIPAGGFDTHAALTMLTTVGSAVAAAHGHGMVHGRVRPQNVLFDAGGHAYLADLGVDEVCAGLTTFAASGYDAPERLGGILATPSADVYSLAVLAHQLLTGTAPPPDRPLPAFTSRAATVLARATDPEPGRRHSSVESLVADLHAAFELPADPTAVFVPTPNPYRGLRAFEQVDADVFYGRDALIGEMIDVLASEPLLVVVGPSGIGKSSAVMAGLLPALARGSIAGSESWLITDMTPGVAPLANLAAAISRIANQPLPDLVSGLTVGSETLDDLTARVVPPAAHMLLVVDQLEEVFTQPVADDEREGFLRVLTQLAATPSSRVRAVATLRADYFDRPLNHPGFSDALRGRTVIVGAMTADELADAVRLPAAAVGVALEPELVERITAEATVEPGGLPLLQHTMTELFSRRATNTLTLAAFVASGGLAGAIGRRAEAIFEGLDPDAQEVTRRVFLRLVTVSDAHDDTRRRVRRNELELSGVSSVHFDTVLREFGQHRLLTFDRDSVTRTPTVELAHEALLIQWERYRRWVEDARDDLLTRRRLELAAQEWLGADSEPSYLYTGGRLEGAESWASTAEHELSADERRFLSASRLQADRDRKIRTSRRRRVTTLLVVALLAALGMAGIAVSQRREADRQAGETRARTRRVGSARHRRGPRTSAAARAGRRRCHRRADR
jgi:DNA-binding SARP family transcriptional activator/serine/threonine protein kinase